MARLRRSTASWPRTPGGQHHVCFEVADILAARDEMRAKGATVLGTGEPRIGAHGVPVIFVHPKDMGGVLVELMEIRTARTDMSLVTIIFIYLMIWWVTLFTILPLGVRSHWEEGIETPGGGDPSSPVDPKLKRKFFTTSWVSAPAILRCAIHLVHLPRLQLSISCTLPQVAPAAADRPRPRCQQAGAAA